MIHITMKKAAIYAATVLISTFGSVFAQSTTTQNLNHAIQSAENMQQDVKDASNAIDALVLQLMIVGNPDANAFHDQLFVLVNNMQNNADDIDYLVGEAKNESPVDFSVAEVTTLTSQVVVLNDDVIGLTGQITAAVTNNRNNEAIALIPQLRQAIAGQHTVSERLVDVIGAIRTNTTVYEVVIQLTDATGNPVYYTDLHGYYTQNQATGEYLYPEQQDGNVFLLTAGTYRFDSFDGYFSGTGSTTVTLADTLVNEDGVIIVELVYWSE
jgi:hypothetical protein